LKKQQQQQQEMTQTVLLKKIKISLEKSKVAQNISNRDRQESKQINIFSVIFLEHRQEESIPQSREL